MKTSATGAFAAAAEPLDDLRMVAMALDAVRLEVVGSLGEQKSHLRLAARAGDAGLAVGDQVRGVDDAGLEQRQEAELHGGRIAAGIADDARALIGVAVDLGQAVDRLLEEVGAGVRHPVPLLEHRGILEPEIRGEIDDLDAPAPTSSRACAIATPCGVAKNTTSHDSRSASAGSTNARS